MSAVRAYRGLKRLASGATYLLFGASLIAGFFYVGDSHDYWTVAKWSGIGAPICATLATLCLCSTGWRLGIFGVDGGLAAPRLRFPTALWILLGIQLPWIAAWIGADAAGGWFQTWWQHGHPGVGPGLYIWGIRLLAGLVTYALASAIGVLITILVDMRVTSHAGRSH